jgi:hypothetical protein
VCIKPVNDPIIIYCQKNLAPPSKAFAVIQTFQLIGAALQCLPEAFHGGQSNLIACSRQLMPQQMFLAAHDWQGGVGIKALSDPGPPGLWYYSHAACSKVVNDKDVQRQSDLFIASDTADWVKLGWVPEGFFPLITINRATNDPDHIAFRDFMHDIFPSLMKPPTLNLSERPGLDKSSADDIVASCLVKSLFDFWIDQETMDDIKFWVSNAKPVAVNKGVPGIGPIAQPRFEKIFKHLEHSVVGKQFVKKAAQIGSKLKEPTDMLREMLFITLFAGIGGTGDTVSSAMTLLNGDDSKVALFWQDPHSFMLEIARLFPAVAGTSGLSYKDETFTLGNGRVYDVPKGTFWYSWTAGANIDPTVFGGPDQSAAYAKKFDPQRDNVDSMMTFTGEFRNIIKCNTTRGCSDIAARPCPGARLAVSTAIQVVKFLLTSAGKTQITKKEL